MRVRVRVRVRVSAPLVLDNPLGHGDAIDRVGALGQVVVAVARAVAPLLSL